MANMPEQTWSAEQLKRRAISNVKALMAERGLNSNAALARAAGIDSGTVGDFLTGRRWPQPQTLVAIERTLGMEIDTINALLEGRDLPSQPPPTGAPTLKDATDLDLVLTLLERIRSRDA